MFSGKCKHWSLSLEPKLAEPRRNEELYHSAQERLFGVDDDNLSPRLQGDSSFRHLDTDFESLNNSAQRCQKCNPKPKPLPVDFQ